MYELFSDSLRRKMTSLKMKFKSPIADYLLKVDESISIANSLLPAKVERIDAGLQSLSPRQTKALEVYSKVFSEIISERISDDCRHLSLRDDDFEISFLPSGKTASYTKKGGWSKKTRQSARPARLIRKLIKENIFNDKDWEEFNTQLKAIADQKEFEFHIVKGREIRKWYHYENSLNSRGSLGSSCMRGSDCQRFFKVYEEQPEVSMVILLKQEKLVGRAILWEFEGRFYMDRIYINDDSLYGKFTKFAADNNFVIRSRSMECDGNSGAIWLYPEDEYRKTTRSNTPIYIELKRMYETWPYMDSVRFLYPDSNILSSGPIRGKGRVIYCTSTGGGPRVNS